MNFSDRIKQLRSASGLTQVELANKIGVGRTTIAEYERGKIVPKQDGLLELSKVFGVSVDYLVGISDNKNPQPNTSNNQQVLQIDDILYNLSRNIYLSMNSSISGIKTEYNNKKLSAKQLHLIREQLNSTLDMIDKIANLDI